MSPRYVDKIVDKSIDVSRAAWSNRCIESAEEKIMKNQYQGHPSLQRWSQSHTLSITTSYDRKYKSFTATALWEGKSAESIGNTKDEAISHLLVRIADREGLEV